MPRHSLSAACLWATCLAAPLGAQDFLLPIPVPHSGFVGDSGFADTGMSVLGGLSYGLFSTLAYDSNVGATGSPAAGGGEGEADTILTLGPSISYRNPGGDFTFGGNLSLSDTTYFNNSDLGGLGYSGSANVGYSGGRFQLSGTISSSLSQGSNFNYDNAYTETLAFSTGIALSYTLSRKTSINSAFSYSWSEPSQEDFSTTYNAGLNVAAMWRYSPLTSIGPGLAWSLSGGSDQQDRQSLGPTVNIAYRLSTKVSANGTFGMQFAESGGGDSQDDSFTTNLEINYRASSLWGMNLALSTGTTANGGIGGGYEDSTSFRFGYNRKIRRATLNLGTSYQSSDISGASAAAADNRDNISFDSSLGMLILSNRVNASIFYNWRDSFGDSALSADGFRVGLSLSTAF